MSNEIDMDIVFATRTFVTGTSGAVVLGTHWPADDPIVKAHPECFTADPRYGLSSSRPLGDDGYPIAPPPRGKASGPVETATAAPGEKRTRK